MTKVNVEYVKDIERGCVPCDFATFKFALRSNFKSSHNIHLQPRFLRVHRHRLLTLIYHQILLSRQYSMAEPNGTASTDSRDPSTFLTSIIGVPVTVKLNSGVVYKGELQSVDGYMNIALEKCQEFVNGKLRRSYGDAFVRGNNVLYISSE